MLIKCPEKSPTFAMTDRHSPLHASADALQNQALAWFAKLRNDRIGPADRAAFDAWLAADPSHRQAYAAIVSFWNSPSLQAAVGAHAALVLPTRRRRTTIRRWAAAAGLLLVGGWLLTVNGWLQTWQADLVTATGEQRTFELVDGSRLTLNTDSAVKLAYSDRQRGVELLRGEAYFEVHPDAARPFLVETAHGHIRVVGTGFDVRQDNTVTVNVAHGVVICTAANGANRRLSAGQRSRIGRDTVSEPVKPDTDDNFGWLKGRLLFRDRTLAEVVAELDRYRPGAIVIADPQLAQTRVTGNYKLDDTDTVVRNLAAVTGARVLSLSPYLTVLNR